jgi:hypothetical protein
MKRVPVVSVSVALFSVTVAGDGALPYWLLGPLLPIRSDPGTVVAVPGPSVRPPERT